MRVVLNVDISVCVALTQVVFSHNVLFVLPLVSPTSVAFKMCGLSRKMESNSRQSEVPFSCFIVVFFPTWV